MMKKNLQEIIKAAAERYGLEYNKEQTQATININGEINVINKEELYKAFNVKMPKIADKWTGIYGKEKSVTWENSRGIHFDFNHDIKSYEYDKEKIVA